MGSIETRPTDSNTSDNLIIGMPYVEFGASDGSGGFEAYRQLGIINEAAITKTIAKAALRSAQSGLDVLVREIVRQLEPRIVVSLYQHSKENMQLIFGSATLTEENAGTAAIVDEAVNLNLTDQNWTDLSRGPLTVLSSLDPAPIVDEAVGTGDGTLGAVLGEYSLDWKPLVIGDVTSVTVAGVTYDAIAVGAGATGLEVEIVVGTGATSGDMQFFSENVAVDVTGAILATYTPSHTLTEDTDFAVDYQDSRIRRITGEQALKNGQPVLVDYTHTTFDAGVLVPYTQPTTSGRARIKLLTDVGINIVWAIPAVDVSLNETDFAFDREEFGTSELEMTLTDDGSVTPFGIMYVYEESAA